MVEVLAIVGGIELLTLTLGMLAFTLLYHVLSDWKASTMGRHFMAFMVSCDLILVWTWVGFMFPIPGIILGWIRVILWGSLAFVVWRQVKILIKLQIIARDTPPKKSPLQPVEENDDGSTT